jgi:hypothetical protein
MQKIVGCDFVFHSDASLTSRDFSINIGVFTASPSPLMKWILQEWYRQLLLIADHHMIVATDQNMIGAILGSGERIFNSTNDYFEVNRQGKRFIVRFFAGTDISNYRHLMEIAQGHANISFSDTRPYIVHLAWLAGIGLKQHFMSRAGYSFFLGGGRCSSNSPLLSFGDLIRGILKV